MALAAHEILKGAYFAMEQAGRLLDDGCALYEERRWASSLILAVYSLEEIGRAEMLLKLAKKAAANGPMAKQQVMDGLDRHLTKLGASRGMSTMVMEDSFADPEQLTELEMHEMGMVERTLQALEAGKITLKKAPHADHRARMRALYVDLGRDGWQRPADTRTFDAFKMLIGAACEYEGRRREFVSPSDSSLAEVRERIAPVLPTLPETRYPATGLGLSGEVRLRAT